MIIKIEIKLKSKNEQKERKNLNNFKEQKNKIFKN